MPTHLLLKGSILSLEEDAAQSLEAELSQAKSSGVIVVEVSDSHLTPELLERLKSARLALIIRSAAETSNALEKTLVLAQQTKARAINLSPAMSENNVDAMALLIDAMIQRASDAKVAVHFVTGVSLAKDFTNTVQLLKAVPAMRLTLDVSSFLSDDKPVHTSDLQVALDPLLNHVEMIHGRIPAELTGAPSALEPHDPVATVYRDIWTEAMRRWRRRKPAGSTLIFTPDAHPADSGRTPNNSGNPDHQDQIAAIWKIAQEAWKASAR